MRSPACPGRSPASGRHGLRGPRRRQPDLRPVRERAGPIAGGLTASTRLMVITTTTAAALAAGSALAGVDPPSAPRALFLLTVLAGVVMVGRRHRPARALHAVRLGLGDDRLPHRRRREHRLRAASRLTALRPSARSRSRRPCNVVTHPGSIDIPSLLAGLAALRCSRHAQPDAARVVRRRSWRWPSRRCWHWRQRRRARVRRRGDPARHPGAAPARPSDLSLNVIGGAFAVAAIVLVQGAGVSESAPNPDGPVRPEPRLHGTGLRQHRLLRSSAASRSAARSGRRRST